MGKVCGSAKRLPNDLLLSVVDDLLRDDPVSASELDAVEAFLMPVVNAILSGAHLGETRKSCSKSATRARHD
jgi:hypothetical protein